MGDEVAWHVARKENTISRYAWLETRDAKGKRAEGTEQRIDERGDTR